MLKKTIATLMVCLLFVLNIYGQKNVQKIYINLGKYAKGIAIPIQNEAGKTTLLISDEDKIHCCLLNDSLQVESVHLIMDDPRLLFKKKHLGNCKRK